ncbi:hypothetical protein Tco_0000934 [Tanacetum coccineum]
MVQFTKEEMGGGLIVRRAAKVCEMVEVQIGAKHWLRQGVVGGGWGGASVVRQDRGCVWVTGTAMVEHTGIMEIEPDIENMTLNGYLDYEAEKERRLWDNVRSRRSPTNYDEADVDSFHQNKKAGNMKRMGQDKLQDSIWEHDNDLEEDQEDDGDDRDTFDM